MAHRRSLVSAVALAAISLPLTASAVENTVEFQLAADPLLDLIAARALEVLPTCPVPFDIFGQQTIVDHVTWGDPSLQVTAGTSPVSFTEGTVQAHLAQIVVPVTASLKTVDCVEDASCPTTDTTDYAVGLAFVLTADQEELCAVYDGTTVPLPGEAQAIVDASAGALGEMCVPLSLGSVLGLLGDGVTVNDVAVTASAAMDRIAVRLELDTPDGSAGSSLADWTAFLSGTISDNLGSDFSLFVDNVMLRRALGRRMTDGMDGGDLTLTSAVGTSWQSWVPQVSMSVDAAADVGLWCAIDIGLEPISIQAPLALGGDGASIQMNSTLDWDVNDADVAACVFLNPLFVFTAPVPFESFLVLEAIAGGYSAANEIEGALPS